MADIDELQPGSKANLGYTNGYTSFYTAGMHSLPPAAKYER